MEQPNWWIFLLTALVPLVLGFIWYHEKVFGNVWMRTAEISEERAQSGNMIKIFGLTYVFSILACYILAMITVHQSAIFQLFFMDPAFNESGSQMLTDATEFMDKYGGRHRSFGHGVIHGMEAALLLGLTFIGIPALFERRPFKYTMIHVGFWMACFGIMGGIICQYF